MRISNIWCYKILKCFRTIIKNGLKKKIINNNKYNYNNNDEKMIGKDEKKIKIKNYLKI